MSYYKISNITLNRKKNIVKVCCACNNVRPLMYNTYELFTDDELSYDDKLFRTMLDFIWGNFHISSINDNTSKIEYALLKMREVTKKLDIAERQRLLDLGYLEFDENKKEYKFIKEFNYCKADYMKKRVGDYFYGIDLYSVSRDFVADNVKDFYIQKLGNEGLRVYDLFQYRDCEDYEDLRSKHKQFEIDYKKEINRIEIDSFKEFYGEHFKIFVEILEDESLNKKGIIGFNTWKNDTNYDSWLLKATYRDEYFSRLKYCSFKDKATIMSKVRGLLIMENFKNRITNYEFIEV